MRVCAYTHMTYVYTPSTSHMSLSLFTPLQMLLFPQPAILFPDSTKLSSPWSLSWLSPVKFFFLHPSGYTLNASPWPFASGQLLLSEITLYICLLDFNLCPLEQEPHQGRNLAIYSRPCLKSLAELSIHRLSPDVCSVNKWRVSVCWKHRSDGREWWRYTWELDPGWLWLSS